MKANEIRIGNWVSKDGEQYQSTANTPQIIERGAIIEPIQLTEGWLLRFGFEKSNDIDSFYHLRIINDWTVIFYNPKLKVCELSISHHCAIIRGLEYVNQLQNLYFALTGQELIINL